MKRWATRHAESFQSLYRFGRSGEFKRFDPTTQWTYSGHTPIGDLLQSGVFTQEWYDSCFKFAFVRNTWTRLASCFEFYRKTGFRRRKTHPFNTYLLLFCDFIGFIVSGKGERIEFGPWPKFNLQQSAWLQWGVDFVGRFENMVEDWEHVCYMAGVPHKLLPKWNSAKGDLRWKSDYRDYYTDKTAALVADYWSEEIDRFGFTFDGGFQNG